MKCRSSRVALVAALIAVVLSGAAAAQPPTADPPDVLGIARKVVEQARFCSLVTFGPDGRAESRIVDPFAPEEDWTVWIATKPVTRKVEQIRQNPRVTLSYWDSVAMGYVTLLGDAELVDDPAAKAKRWKSDWAPFYQDENRGADYLLIRVTPRRLEVVSIADGLNGDPETWRPAQHVFE